MITFSHAHTADTLRPHDLLVFKKESTGLVFFEGSLGGHRIGIGNGNGTRVIWDILAYFLSLVPWWPCAYFTPCTHILEAVTILLHFFSMSRLRRKGALWLLSWPWSFAWATA